MLHKTAYSTAVIPSPGREASLSPAISPFLVPGWDISLYATIDSTNLEGRRRLAAGRGGRQIIVAESQSRGQCRHDRLWESKEGCGMWASFILPVAVPFSALAQSTLVLAVAVREAVKSVTGVELEMKWPNDLLGGGKKCCGLLVESGEIVPGAKEHPLILGVGINIHHNPEDFSEYLRGVATSLSILAGGKGFSRDALVAAVAEQIGICFARWEKEGFSPIRKAWLEANRTLGNRIILPEGYGYSHATAHDLDDSGALVALADDGTALLIDSGEILFIHGEAAGASRKPCFSA